MQKVTTAASLELMRASDRDPIRRWVHDNNDAATRPALVDASDLGRDCLSR